MTLNHTESSSSIEVPVKGGNGNNMPLCSPKGRNISDSDDATILLSTPSLDSTMCYKDDISLGESLLSPISLKQNCLQVLSQCVAVLRPPSLYHVCVDFMAWNHDNYFNSNLVLPRSMTTASQVIELRNFTPTLVEVTDDTGLSQITMYENMKVDWEVHKYWLQQAHTRKYSVSLPILSAESIQLWCDPRSLDRWKEIDPYSDLEDIGSNSDKAGDSLETPPKSPTMKYTLRIRKPVRHHSERPPRAASSNIVYYNDSEDETLEPVKK